MSTATAGSVPYRNPNLFSGYYLDERVDDLGEWDDDAGAEADLIEHVVPVAVEEAGALRTSARRPPRPSRRWIA